MSAQMHATVLIVDDTPDIRELLSLILEQHDFFPLTAAGGVEMDAALKQHRVDLIILDTMMPDEDGLSICRRLQGDEHPPVIMLSARGEDIDRIKGLDLGAEDYMAKPFNPDELIARINVVLRRRLRSVRQAWVKKLFFGWSLESATRQLITPHGVGLTLSAAEFAAMKVLLDYPDRPLRREFMLEKMAAVIEIPTPRALDTIISRLRRRLTKVQAGTRKPDDLIRTVYGVGYMLRPNSEVLK
ncbi:response regulator [Asticcacaulis machinosus]|uniref:Response regulator transcription factor n=1 Tax=Asticcacaulis machinosus TaxID=2984211 RepID=A0ABT5HPE7_9CAUL|nr:response regulator transcription factor [Asticcacaulis machinosus]MDC7677514.1 response regulator transcription factor [Asticcacaulis machinosus]